MGNIVAQNASTQVICGPFMTTGGALVADLTIANNQIVLVKENGSSAARSDAVSCTSVGPGLQLVNLNATDTNTLGTLTIFVSASAVMPYVHRVEVWNSATWNAYYGADPLLGSAATSVLIQGALVNYDVPTSADISAIVTVVVKNVFTNMDVATSTGISAAISIVASAVAGRALTNYQALTSAAASALISVVVQNALTLYDVPTSADISAIVTAVVNNVMVSRDIPGSASISGAMIRAISQWEIPSSANLSVIVAGALTNYDIPTSADISAIVGPAVWNKAGAEPTTAPDWGSVSRGTGFDWLLARSLNRHSQTTGTIEIYTSAGGVMASASVSNNSVSATRDQFRG